MLKLSKSVEGVKLCCSNVPDCFCDICSNSKGIARKSSKLELVCSDVRGPMETTSLGGQRYVVSFIDSFSRFARAYIMRNKSEGLDKICQFYIDEGEPKTFASKMFRSDGGQEYDNKTFDKICFSQGIKSEIISVFSPHQNGVAEG